MSDRTCSIPGCDGVINARGWCGGHYARWRLTGDPQPDLPLDSPVPKGTTCKADDCDDPYYCLGWCVRHYNRWRMRGSVEDRPNWRKGKVRGIYPAGSKSPHEWIACVGCGERALVRVGGKGYCSRACGTKHQTGAGHPLWKGADAGYVSLHKRVYRRRGKADHCERCGRNDPDGIYQWANLTGRYEDIWDFEQMCVTCHAAYDTPGKRRGSASPTAKLTEVAVAEARRRHAAGESGYAMSREYGVSAVAMMNAIKRRTWKHVA